MYSQTPISNEKNGPPQLAIPGATCSTQKGTNTIPNAAPQDLGNKRGFFRQGYVDDTKACRSSLSKNDILRLEKLSDTRPQPRLGNNVVGLVWNGEDEWRNGDLQSSFFEPA